METYHAPEFESNIIWTSLLAKTYDITFSEYSCSYNACLFFRTGTHEVIAEYPLKEFMYPMELSSRSTSKAYPSCIMYQTNKNEVDKWHLKAEHSHTERYYALSQLFAEVPKFDRLQSTGTPVHPWHDWKGDKSSHQTFRISHLETTWAYSSWHSRKVPAISCWKHIHCSVLDWLHCEIRCQRFEKQVRLVKYFDRIQATL